MMDDCNDIVAASESEQRNFDGAGKLKPPPPPSPPAPSTR